MSKYNNLFDDEPVNKQSSKGAKVAYNETKPGKMTTYPSGTYKSGTSMTPTKKCAHTHPPLAVGDGLFIHGGACSSPITKNMDVSVGLDRGFYPQGVDKGMAPWDGKIEMLYEIEDMNVPKSVESFRKLIDFLEESIRAGKVVHVGCIGGHGRTGMVLAALVKQMLPDEKDSIGYVRANYCKKAVESQKQVDWLNKHFDIKKAAPAKPSYSGGGSSGSTGGYSMNGNSSAKLADGTVTAMDGPDCIWYMVKGVTPTVKKVS